MYNCILAHFWATRCINSLPCPTHLHSILTPLAKCCTWSPSCSSPPPSQLQSRLDVRIMYLKVKLYDFWSFSFLNGKNMFLRLIFASVLLFLLYLNIKKQPSASVAKTSNNIKRKSGECGYRCLIVMLLTDIFMFRMPDWWVPLPLLWPRHGRVWHGHLLLGILHGARWPPRGLLLCCCCSCCCPSIPQGMVTILTCAVPSWILT